VSPIAALHFPIEPRFVGPTFLARSTGTISSFSE
jgi:hypothetical protein